MNELLRIATRRHVRSEKAEERLCDNLMAKLGFTVVRFSQARATNQTLGIPDRRYRNTTIGRAFWWEVKAANGKLSEQQFLFLRGEQGVGDSAGCGTLDDLLEWQKRKFNFGFGEELVLRWSQKGFR